MQQDRLTEWIDAFQQAHDPDDPDGLEWSFRARWTVDQHLLVISANHLVTAVQGADATWLPGLPLDEVIHAIEILRDVFEHWDEQRPSFERPGARSAAVRSGKLFDERWPESGPWDWKWNTDTGLMIGPLSVPELGDWMLALEERLRELDAWPTSD